MEDLKLYEYPDLQCLNYIKKPAGWKFSTEKWLKYPEHGAIFSFLGIKMDMDLLSVEEQNFLIDGLQVAP